eukprot:GHVU01066234.1.p1 GENE.GHVU01066234.1~~GHVU01066234.1.p1  ORF type:complete len:112 (+),score=10.37 GHVU01066234.1:396-731(+)
MPTHTDTPANTYIHTRALNVCNETPSDARRPHSGTGTRMEGRRHDECGDRSTDSSDDEPSESVRVTDHESDMTAMMNDRHSRRRHRRHVRAMMRSVRETSATAPNGSWLGE